MTPANSYSLTAGFIASQHQHNINTPSITKRIHLHINHPASKLYLASSLRPSRTKPRGRRNNASSPVRKQTSVKKTPKPQRLSVEDASSLGEAIQRAASIDDYLSIIDKFVWLPTDDGLAPHLRTQAIHHEKRRRWGSQLIEGLGNAALNIWENDPKEMILQLSPGGDLRHLWSDKRLLRAISSVSMEFGEGYIERPEKEGVWITTALKGLHVLASCISPVTPEVFGDEFEWRIQLLRQISKLIQSADSLVADERTTIKDVVEVRWAIRGLLTRLQLASVLGDSTNTAECNQAKSREQFFFTTPNMNARTSKLPFDILPHCLPWQINQPPALEYSGYPTQSLVSEMLESIPFKFDTLTTRTGDSVVERRGTAWLAEEEEGIGALAYSGKLMPPQPVPDNVSKVMRHIEHWCSNQGAPGLHFTQTISLLPDGSSIELIWKDNTSNNMPFLELGQLIDSNGDTSTFFDCALCNHYPDGDAACKYHTDPEHGSHWHRTTAVVSLGTSRKFAFRPIPDVSTWAEWDPIITNNGKQSKDDTSCAPAAIQLFPGDVVLMTGPCNDLFHHAVYASPFDDIGVQNSRVSLVLKRALDRGGGKKGHSLAGQGRRARRNT